MNIEVHVEPLAGSRLVEDYVAGDPALAGYFTGSPRDPTAYRRKAAEVGRRFDAARRRALAAAIRPSSPSAAARLEQVVSEEGFFVTTGQQAGLLTGPLYTVHKILTAVRLARQLEEVLERPVAPLFWIASEDHDWDEASCAVLVGEGNHLERVQLPDPDGESTASMRRRLLDERVVEVVRRVAELLPRSEFADGVLSAVNRSYRPGRSVASAFEDLIVEWFAPFDLLVVDGGHPVVKELAAEVVAREIERSADHERLVAEQTERLTRAGYHAQVRASAGATQLFFEDEAGRDRLLRDGGGFRLRRSGRRLRAGEVQNLLRRDPSRFSPNVLLRPVVENAVFPTVSYVAGPGELSYYAQVGCLFQAHGLEMPVVFPRASVTLVEPRIRRVLDKFGLDPAAVRIPLQELAGRFVRDELPAEVKESLSATRQQVVAGYERLLSSASAIDPTLRGPVTSARNTSLRELGEVEKKLVQAMKRQQSIHIEQLGKAYTSLWPDGKPQERVLNVIPFLARYGPGLLPAIAERIATELGTPAPLWSGVRCVE